MLLKDIHKDMERYLENDCYCPGEIYDVSGFFFEVFEAGEECKEIYRGKDFRNPEDTVITVVCRNQLINFWVRDDRVYSAERYDATDNNIKKMPLYLADGNRFELDEFKPGKIAKSLNEIMSMADAICIGG